LSAGHKYGIQGQAPRRDREIKSRHSREYLMSAIRGVIACLARRRLIDRYGKEIVPRRISRVGDHEALGFGHSGHPCFREALGCFPQRL
jgi:hypothetical protein